MFGSEWVGPYKVPKLSPLVTYALENPHGTVPRIEYVEKARTIIGNERAHLKSFLGEIWNRQSVSPQKRFSTGIARNRGRAEQEEQQ